jgi:hypothetical protein
MKTNWPLISCQASLILAKAHKQKSRTHGCGFFNVFNKKEAGERFMRSPAFVTQINYSKGSVSSFFTR